MRANNSSRITIAVRILILAFYRQLISSDLHLSRTPHNNIFPQNRTGCRCLTGLLDDNAILTADSICRPDAKSYCKNCDRTRARVISPNFHSGAIREIKTLRKVRCVTSVPRQKLHGRSSVACGGEKFRDELRGEENRCAKRTAET